MAAFAALITGGLGFIGSNLARRLVADGARVTVVDNLAPTCGGNPFNLDGVEDRVRIVVADARDVGAMRPLVRGQDVLFNLAGQSSHLDSLHDPLTDLELNCRAVLGVLEACRHENPGVRAVFASTRQIYGRPARLPVDEAHPVQPVDPNGVHKLAGELYHRLYAALYGMPTCILRLTNTIGPRMCVRDARQTFLGVWVRAVVEGTPFEVWGGEQLRDFTYVDDAVEALVRAAVRPEAVGRVFNVGGDGPVRLRALADLLVEVAGGGRYSVVPFPPERRAIDIGDYWADDRALRAALGWAPRVPLREALRRTVGFYRAHLARYTGPAAT